MKKLLAWIHEHDKVLSMMVVSGFIGALIEGIIVWSYFGIMPF